MLRAARSCTSANPSIPRPATIPIAAVTCRKSKSRCAIWWTVDGGRWTVDGGRWTVDGARQQNASFHFTRHSLLATNHQPPLLEYYQLSTLVNHYDRCTGGFHRV